MTETNHIQSGNKLYCQRFQEKKRKSIIKNTDQHFQRFCLSKCSYYAGNYQGNGVECKFYDGTNIPIVINPDPGVLRSTMTGSRKGKLNKLKNKRR